MQILSYYVVFGAYMQFQYRVYSFTYFVDQSNLFIYVLIPMLMLTFFVYLARKTPINFYTLRSIWVSFDISYFNGEIYFFSVHKINFN